MSDSGESESRTAAVGRKRYHDSHGKSDSCAIIAAASGVESGSRSESDESKESGEISSSSSASRRGGQQGQKRPHPQDSDDDSDSDSEPDSSDTDSSSERDDSEDEAPDHSMASPLGQATQQRRAKRCKVNELDLVDPLRIRDVSSREADEQELYFFHFEKDGAVNKDVVRCFCCGEQGHIREGCPHRTCEHCGARDQHVSWACPKGRKCARCRQRGHDSKDCTNTTRPYGYDLCDVCGETGHVEEECTKLWWTNPRDPMAMKAVRRMWRVCYNCGDEGWNAHWGDDCPRLDRSILEGIPGQIRTWSAQHANQYIDPYMSDSEDEHVPKKKPKDDVKDDSNENVEKDAESESEDGEVKNRAKDDKHKSAEKYMYAGSESDESEEGEAKDDAPPKRSPPPKDSAPPKNSRLPPKKPYSWNMGIFDMMRDH